MDILGATTVLKWNECLLDFLGVWPSNLNNARFLFFFVYITVQCFLQYAGLFEHISDLKYVVANLAETVVFCMILFNIAIYRIHAKRLHQLIRRMQQDYSNELYKTAKERTIFVKYNALSNAIVRCMSVVCTVSGILFYIAPLNSRLLPHDDSIKNSSSLFVLPYHIRLFFNLTEARTYYIIYACEILIVPMCGCGYAAPCCLLITLVLHICGQMSILASQVKSMMQDPKILHQQLKQIVIKHRRLISFCASLNSTYSTFLLQQIVAVTILLCLGCYNIIMNPVFEETGQFLSFFCYVLTLFVQLFGFCYMGECLIHESIKLCNAFYNCEWYNASIVHRRLILMCVIRSQKPLELTAGKLFMFSLKNFTIVMKTSMAYLSVLRNFI